MCLLPPDKVLAIPDLIQSWQIASFLSLHHDSKPDVGYMDSFRLSFEHPLLSQAQVVDMVKYEGAQRALEMLGII